jgi:putative endonuclease
MRFSYVYIVTNKPRAVLYIGVTSEVHEEITLAIQREKNLKRWYREWKIALVEVNNPEWRDLFFDFSGLSQ